MAPLRKLTLEITDNGWCLSYMRGLLFKRKYVVAFVHFPVACTARDIVRHYAGFKIDHYQAEHHTIPFSSWVVTQSKTDSLDIYSILHSVYVESRKLSQLDSIRAPVFSSQLDDLHRLCTLTTPFHPVRVVFDHAYNLPNGIPFDTLVRKIIRQRFSPEGLTAEFFRTLSL